MKSILIFSPNLIGHRQIYASVIGNWALHEGFKVIIAGSLFPTFTNSKDCISIITEFGEKENVTLVDISDRYEIQVSESGQLTPAILELEAKYQPDWTILPNADMYRKLYMGLAAASPIVHSKRTAIINGASWFYIKENIQINENEKKTILNPLRKMRKKSLQHLKIRKEKYFYEKGVFDEFGLEFSFSTDKYFLANVNTEYEYYYLPEIYKTWDARTTQESDASRNMIIEYDNFLKICPHKDVLLYMGGWNIRKGYDVLLKLVHEFTDTVFVSIGPARKVDGNSEVEKYREILTTQRRLFEYQIPFLANDCFFDKLYESTKYIIAPYQDFYGISGTLITAASYGKPILMPDIGHSARIIHENPIGITYEHLVISDLYKKYKVLKQTYADYVESCCEFSTQFSKEMVYNALSYMTENN